MNQLPLQKRMQIINLLVEGCSMRATARVCDVSRNTVNKLLVEVGTACQQFHNERMIDINARRVQCDEIWSFVYAKNKNVPGEMENVGDVWTWTAIDADTKLVISYLVGSRDAECANIFIRDIRERVNSRMQLTTDGLKVYVEAIDNAFGNDIDFAQLIKIYGDNGSIGNEKRYSPAECTGTRKHRISGAPDKKHISTSYVERQNLTMRMHMRRFTRLTNAFSKKLENHIHSLALYFVYYNFCKIHQTLRVTPAMEAGLTNDIMSIEEIILLTEKKSN